MQRFLVFALFALSTLSAAAQSRGGKKSDDIPADNRAQALSKSQYPIIIRDARVGLPPGRFVTSRDDQGRPANVSKSNMWAPVYLSLEIAKEVKKEAAVIIEADDSDKLHTFIMVPLQSLIAEQPGTRLEAVELRTLPYVRSGGGEVKITIRVPEPNTNYDSWSRLSETHTLRFVLSRDVSRYVVCSLGSNMPGFTLPKEAETDQNAGSIGSSGGLRNGRIETAMFDDVAKMPDHWYGYDAADLIVLCTGTDDRFLTSLFSEATHKPRLDALLEWVRRGGRLVVSVGRNANICAQFPALQEILPLQINREDPGRQESKLNITWALSKINRPLGAIVPKSGGTFPVANLTAKPGKAARMLVPASSTEKPVVATHAYGMGRVSLVAFDLERSPYLDYADRAEFWDLILRESGAAKASTGGNRSNPNNYSYGTPQDLEDGAANDLRNATDTFDGIPVISFGWVAFFIVIYTLLIGPIEYFFLKKVLKKLELTWITFPIIVLTVSAIAYFSAYAMKGDDLKLNKVDVLDIDPATGRIYGHTWLSLFSPRIDRYTVGIEPAPGWIDATSTAPQVGARVDWSGGLNTGRESLITRSYVMKSNSDREPFGGGLQDVPVPIWSTKAFTVDWSGAMDANAPLVVSNLNHPPANPLDVAGSFTLNLPLPPIADAIFLYRDRAWKQENPIVMGQPVNVFLDEKASDAQWLQKFQQTTALKVLSTPQTSRRVNTSTTPTSLANSTAGILFHEASMAGNDSAAPQNSSLRRLDQSWRLHPKAKDELIVVARLTAVKGTAEEVLTSKETASPTMLWLRALPGNGARAPIPGTLQQDTYIRVYIPIPPSRP